MGKRIFPVVIAGVLALGMVMGMQTALGQQPPDLHCPDHETNTKISGNPATQTVDGVQVTIAGDDVTFTNTNPNSVVVTWCAKGGQNFDDGDQTSGVRTTTLSVGQTRSFDFDQDVSYVVIYSVVEGGGNGGGPPGNGNGGNGGGGGGGGGDGDGDGGGGGGEGAAPAGVIEEQPTVTG